FTPEAMSERSSGPSLLLLILLVALLALLAGRDRPAVPREHDQPAPALEEHSAVTLTAGQACLDAGYLCDELARADSLRVLRWPDTVSRLRVRVPVPELADAARSRELRNAAVRGILAWQDAPLRIEVSGEDVDADVVVSWTSRPQAGRLGETRLEWRERDGVVTFRVPRLELATVSPLDGRPLSGGEVELVAVHEMGHALGLPHSDSPDDVMHAEKTARFLTTRDHRTVQALYRIPTGALIVP
ncbi:MAG TPA: matrixin family metalloprotease, partial [Longimicrobiales bacterium]|nr:matrixin family metalloprotease [Longimicrobiales bacterium]